jgi:hypothetical protein
MKFLTFVKKNIRLLGSYWKSQIIRKDFSDAELIYSMVFSELFSRNLPNIYLLNPFCESFPNRF